MRMRFMLIVGCATVCVNSASLADDPAQLGACSLGQSIGDQCALGICAEGKQTVYTCNQNRQCVKSAEKQSCKEVGRTEKRSDNPAGLLVGKAAKELRIRAPLHLALQ